MASNGGAEAPPFRIRREKSGLIRGQQMELQMRLPSLVRLEFLPLGVVLLGLALFSESTKHLVQLVVGLRRT